MKVSIILLPVLLFLVPSSFADEFVTLVAPPKGDAGFSETPPQEIKSGETVKVVYCQNPGSGPLRYRIGNLTIRGRPPHVIAGPATFWLWNNTDAPSMATVEILRTPVVPATTIGSVIALPGDQNEAFVVALESSSDLLSWRTIEPGLISDPSRHRFVRARGALASWVPEPLETPLGRFVTRSVPSGWGNLTNEMTVGPDEVLSEVFTNGATNPSLEVTIGPDKFLVGTQMGQSDRPVVAGPAKVKMAPQLGTDENVATTFRIEPNSPPAATAMSGILTIPADSEVFFVATLEASKDMIQWQPVDPTVVESDNETIFIRARLAPESQP